MQNDFWTYLFDSTEVIEAADEKNVIEVINSQLKNIEMIFGKKFDPADSFEEYVTTKFINRISQVIEKARAEENVI